MMSYMSPQMIDEIEDSKKKFIHSTPQIHMNDFTSNLGKKWANRKADDAHPFSGSMSNTLYEDPLIVGSLKDYKTYFDFNNRTISSNLKHMKKMHGGAELYAPVMGGDLSDTSSDSDDEIESDESESDGDMGGAMHKKHKMHCMEGAGIYSDYVKPAAKFVGHVGKEIVKDVLIPVGKELVIGAVKKAITGGKAKKHKPKMVCVETPCMEGGVKRPINALKNLEEEASRVSHEISFEKGMKKAKSKKQSAMEAVNSMVDMEKPKAKRVASHATKMRAEIVKQVMKEHGLKLGPASKYVKEHGLYKKESLPFSAPSTPKAPRPKKASYSVEPEKPYKKYNKRKPKDVFEL